MAKKVASISIAFDAELRGDVRRVGKVEGFIRKVPPGKRCVLCGESYRATYQVTLDTPGRGIDRLGFCEECLSTL